MAKKFGSIELGEAFGGYEIVNIPASKLPQDVASAMGAANGNLLGATYNPIWYVGKQLVNGINHFFIAEDIRATKNKDKSIVGLVINAPLGRDPSRARARRSSASSRRQTFPRRCRRRLRRQRRGLSAFPTSPLPILVPRWSAA